jgi:hypothetical protein
MKPLALLGLIAPLLIAACGDDGGTSTGTGATTDSTTGGSTETGPTTGPTTSTSSTTDTTGGSMGETTGIDTTSTSTSTATDSTDTADTAGVTDTDATATTTTGTTTGDTTDDTTSGSSDSTTETPSGDPLAISLKDVIIYGNCMPIIDPDSVIGFWTVTYDNSQGVAATSAELTKATLTLSLGNNPSVHDITVVPDQSGPIAAGQKLDQEQMKQQGAPTPGCGSCNQPYRLDLTFQSGGVDVPVVHEAALDCVY